jgi:HEAT repeat protein
MKAPRSPGIALVVLLCLAGATGSARTPERTEWQGGLLEDPPDGAADETLVARTREEFDALWRRCAPGDRLSPLAFDPERHTAVGLITGRRLSYVHFIDFAVARQEQGEMAVHVVIDRVRQRVPAPRAAPRPTRLAGIRLFPRTESSVRVHVWPDSLSFLIGEIARRRDSLDALRHLLEFAQAAEERPPPGSAMPVFFSLLSHEEPAVRRYALVHLESYRSLLEREAEKVLAALKDPDVRVRIRAMYLVPFLGPRAHAAVPLLAAALRDSRETRSASESALAALGPAAAGAIPALIELLGSAEGEQESGHLIHTLDAIGDAAVPPLIEALRAATTRARRPLLLALERFGASARSAVPAIVPELRTKEMDVRSAAASALAKIGCDRPEAVAVLVEWLRRDGPSEPVLDVLASIGPLAREALPDLIAATKHERYEVRRSALRALGAVDPDAAVPIAVASLSDRLVLAEAAAVLERSAIRDPHAAPVASERRHRPATARDEAPGRDRAGRS